MLKLNQKRPNKLIVAALICGLSVNLNAFVFTDPSNLIQNTITAIEEIASYARQVSDGIRQIQEFEKNAIEFTNETLGIADMLGDINTIMTSISDILQSQRRYRKIH